MGRRRDTPDFAKSNRIHSINFKPTAEERSITRKLIGSDQASIREACGQRLLNRMCERLRIPPVRLRVQDAHQPHKRKSGKLAYKEYGAYYLEDQVIVIANLTAVRGKVVAGKTFFDTLIHEFMHHVDRTSLRLPSTPHSPGFYNRIDDLKHRLTGGGPVETQPERGRWEKPPKGLLAALAEAAKAARENGSVDGARLRPAASEIRKETLPPEASARSSDPPAGSGEPDSQNPARRRPLNRPPADKPGPPKQLSLNLEI